MKPKEILLPALALCVICAVFTGALAVVQDVTKEPIANNQLAEVAAAREAFFPGAEFEDVGGCWHVYQDGERIGAFVETQAQGYGGPITIAVGLGLDGRVLKIQVLSAEGETPGLGQRITEEGFLGRFLGKESPDEIDSIAGATFSSNGLKDAVRQALEIDRRIGGGTR